MSYLYGAIILLLLFVMGLFVAYTLRRLTQLENVVDELIQLVGTVSAASHDRDDWLTSRIEVLSEQAGFAARRQHLLDQRVYRDPEIITPVDGEGAA